jgi:murein DD-endopeptidase MepM/ murein hydrolase activator NlpD
MRDVLARARGAPFVPPPPLFGFDRPFQGEGLEQRSSAFYPYGTDGGGEYLLHHGIDISNAQGTLVRAVADGEVVYAGDDRSGEPWGKRDERLPRGFYGQLVVIRHADDIHDLPLFSLYGHLSEVMARKRQFIRAGEVLGKVGSEGVALGPHLHLEIRVNAQDYTATRNPELFIKHLPERGTIVGRVSDAEGRPLPDVEVGLYAYEGEGSRRWLRQTSTYPADRVNSVEMLGENFVFGDLEPGIYSVSAESPGGLITREVTVFDGLPSGIVLRR